MLSRIGILSLTLCSFLPLSSCREDNSKSSNPLAITNRSTKVHPYELMMIKFKNPPLLSSSTTQDGKISVNDTLKKNILKEQAEAESYLKSLSRDIRIVYKYRLVLNGFLLAVPTEVLPKLDKVPGLSDLRRSQNFTRPKILVSTKEKSALDENTSVKHIGAEKVLKEFGYNGEGIHVGIIDTGIDYTHKMFGGEGTEEAYKSINPNQAHPSFPNEKVVGGLDLVGTDYNDASHDVEKRIPKPNPNPLDEGSHGTHVAGTVSGIGDGDNTYTGVAPGAKLHAIKVFGKSGSTSDAVVIAGLEYAVDPNQDLDPNDHLHVINLSLGSPYGGPFSLYNEAMENLIKADVIAVMSAGNSGNNPYITGLPGATNHALSVAASVDNMPHNWKFEAVLFKGESQEHLTKAVEATFTKPIKECKDLKGELVFIGLADKDLSEETKTQVQGKVALIDRGAVIFGDKVKRAFNAGAIGVVVVNNEEGEPIVMSGSKNFDIPAIMIPQTLGKSLKESLEHGEVVSIDFTTDQQVEDPTLIDTLTGFSSRGPRSLDSLLKPEISAPGSSILSAKSGSGDKATSMSGTSMASPHVAGCAALLKQAHPDWTFEQIKSSLMTQSKSITDKTGKTYPVTRQGAGRVDIHKSIKDSFIVSSPVSLSLGEIQVVEKKFLRKKLTLENLSDKNMSVHMRSESSPSVKYSFPNEVLIHAKSKAEVFVNVSIQASDKVETEEVSGFLYILNDEEEVLAKIPSLAVVRTISLLEAGDLKVHSSRKEDSQGVPAELTLHNRGSKASEALIFNLLGKSTRKAPIGPFKRRSDVCDLESFGYRTVIKNGEKLLQFAAKLHSPLTSWHYCEISVLIDGNGDGIADQELLGSSLRSLDESSSYSLFKSILTDAETMREVREAKDRGEKVKYSFAILEERDLHLYNHGTLMVLNVPLSKIKVRDFGLMKVKVAAIGSEDGMKTPDDYLENKSKWLKIDPFESASAYYGMPEFVKVPGNSTVEIPLTHGESMGEMIVYFPHNRSSLSYRKDLQSAKITETFHY